MDVHDGESTRSGALKVGQTMLKRIIYTVADYWLMAASAAFIIWMDRQFGYDAVGLFLLMWAFDLVVANAFVVVWKRTGEDVTLGESYRRAADTIYHGSRIAGYIAFTNVVIKAAFWDGPEHIVIFFHKEFNTEWKMLGMLLGLTAIQAAIYTPIYVLGFDTAYELWGYIMTTYSLYSDLCSGVRYCT